jgi:hypothetical protein
MDSGRLHRGLVMSRQMEGVISILMMAGTGLATIPIRSIKVCGTKPSLCPKAASLSSNSKKVCLSKLSTGHATIKPVQRNYWAFLAILYGTASKSMVSCIENRQQKSLMTEVMRPFLKNAV